MTTKDDGVNRRRLIAFGGLGVLAVATSGTAATLRLHRTPRRFPLLEETHLSDLAQADLPRPRVLFVGNSMILHHDVPARVAARAGREDVTLSVAMAAARGARLVETMRLDGLAPVLRKGWEAVVVQDFSSTPFRGIDRLGSAWAIGRIKRLAAPAAIIVVPSFPASPGNRVYRDAGVMGAPPASPEDHARQSMAHFAPLGDITLPLPERWLAALATGRDLYAEDGHHPSEAGADLMAELIWDALRDRVL